MPDFNHTHTLRVELNAGVTRRVGGALLGSGDKNADTYELYLYKASEGAGFDATACTGYFIRPDGETVIIAGSVQDNIAEVTLPAACYAFAGTFSLAIKLSDADTDVTAVIIDGRVISTTTDTVADPDDVWSLAAIEAAIRAKVNEPSQEGTSGQALLTDGNGNRYWGSAASSGATGSLIVDGQTYSLRTGTEGAEGYITLVEEST